MSLRSFSLADIQIEDEASFAHVGRYVRLKQVVLGAKHRFLVPEPSDRTHWDRALFLNLTFWSAEDGADVLCEGSLAADVVTHIAWHHLAAVAMARAGGPGRPSAAAFFCGEAIASAFDLYLVGYLLARAPNADFILTQVPILRDVAHDAGVSDEDFAALLADIAERPEQAFEDLRSLLFQVSVALFACEGAEQAHEVLGRYSSHRFEPLLHHFQLSNWILHARAYAAPSPAHDAAANAVHAALCSAPVSLEWLDSHWLDGAHLP